MKTNTLNFIIPIVSFYFFFEYIHEKQIQKKIKNQIEYLFKKKKCSKNLNKTINELNKLNHLEKNHIYKSSYYTFHTKCSNTNEIICNLNSYHDLRNNSYDKIFEKNICNKLWYPYIFRFLFSIYNGSYILKCKMFYNVSIYNSNILYINVKENKKHLILFLGLGGMLWPFNNIIDFYINKGYNIIIPLHGPSQSSLNYNLNLFEEDYYDNIVHFLKEKYIDTFTILCWSLGGVLYKGFHNYINDNYNHLKIKEAYLIEPLINTRGCIDTYFSHIRNFKDTLKIMNSVTSKEYKNYNIIFTYFLHTIVGFGTQNSMGYFSNNETNTKYDINYPRYLFISTDDIIINYKLDKNYIQNNYENHNVFHKKGYHGGWPEDNKIINILDQIVK